jgi:hypothetical protein
MPNQITTLAQLFKALADPNRLRILGLLLTGEVCVCHIHESLKIPQSKASRHLAYLPRGVLLPHLALTSPFNAPDSPGSVDGHPRRRAQRPAAG